MDDDRTNVDEPGSRRHRVARAAAIRFGLALAVALLCLLTVVVTGLVVGELW